MAAPIELFTSPSPNGRKISIMLEELGVPYTVKALKLSKMEQKEDWFLKINPNGRIPAIVDHENGDFPVFESGAILIYLAEKYGKFLPQDPNKRSEVIQWLMFQMSALGPMQGQATVFYRLVPEKIEFAINRYHTETKRIYGVLDKQLESREYLVDELSIADIATYPWIVNYEWAGITSIDDYPHLKRWMTLLSTRIGFQRGMDVPESWTEQVKNQQAKIQEHQKIVTGVKVD